ncbi:MAG: NAD(P)/FAD-dependent oxidoreductase [Solirubrobacterales bacterium]
MPERFDAIVVGGGFAGVTAARELGVAGLRTVLLEARDRLGGRTLTTSFAGKEVVELGGTWVDSTHPNVWAEITRYGLKVIPDTAPETYVVREGGSLVRRDPDYVVNRLRAVTETLFADAAAAFPDPGNPDFGLPALIEIDRLSLADRLDQAALDPRDRDLLSGWLMSLVGLPNSEAGLATFAHWWALAGSDFDRFQAMFGGGKLEAGMAALIGAIVADADAEVRLSTEVAAVRSEAESVTVTTAGGEELTAPIAVIALPLNLLGGLDFDPGLPAQHVEAAEEKIAAPHGRKLLIHVVGDAGGVQMMLPEDEPLPLVFTYAQLERGQLLVGISGHPEFDADDTSYVRNLVELAFPELCVLDIATNDWPSDRYAGGAWTYPRREALTRWFPRLAEPVGRLVFAGADVSVGLNWIDGAIESGHRAAAEAAWMIG